ncbi:MAG: glycosyltransferase [Candidatus Marinimicrobia bacterium]|nr:glycosyltransferase [Candidatus Neomarinimicrobiota bacterium]
MYSYRFSIIVPTYNRLDEIRELLDSLEKQSLGKDAFEVLVVDDGSTDNTAAYVAEKLQQGSLNLRFISQDHKGPGPARNLGMENAQGEYYLFIDSDCIAHEDWLKAYDEALTEKVAGFGGPDRVREDFSPLQKAIDYSMTSFLTTGGIRGSSKKKISKYYPRSFNMGVHAEVVRKIGGFGSLRHGQDIEFTHRIRKEGRVIKVMDAVVYHKRRTSLWRFFKQVYNWGVARINLYKIDKGMLEFIHFFPFIGTLIVLAALIAFFLRPAQLWPLAASGAALLLLMALHAAVKYRDIRVLPFVPLVVPIQILGYGLGFGAALIRRVIFGGKETAGFVKHYYK